MATTEQVKTVTAHYLHALLWTAPGNDECENPGDVLDVQDLPKHVYDAAYRDCDEFIARCGKLFDAAMACYDSGYGYSLQGKPEAAFGHDYALTRNGHGTGFWDRESEGLPREIGDKLTELCKHQEKNLIIDPDGSIYYE